ncbi:hypothetical protein PR048_021074 [Dryococelus australis]|uniref:Mutator-like transposase domain-containing protein n=1 Tax=Dryococelus australis TaxID=614101 RepID=A0ABQ9GXA2_9NEOP|nr:hypothetical protein PR048_021074 [Dryococelus australis]
MTRMTGVFMKRKFRGNGNHAGSLDSASKTKLSNSDDAYSSVEHGNCDLFYILVDFSILETIFSDYLCCNLCGEPVTLKEELSARSGLATKSIVLCVNFNFSNPFYISKKRKGDLFESDVRFVYGMRAIGKGPTAAKLLSGILNLPQPPSKMNKYTEIIGTAVETHLTVLGRSVAAPQKTLATVTSVDSGKVLDSEVLTKHCLECNFPTEQHKCDKNYEGASGGMEAAAAVKIWNRSEKDRNVCYTEFLGDGGSKTHEKENGYQAEKAGAVIERKKLSDSKTIYVRLSDTTIDQLQIYYGRLSDTTIDQLQIYYGTAIRSNTNNLGNWSVNDAVISFNEGNFGRVKVIEELDISTGPNAVKTFKFLDKVRIQKLQRAAELSTKKARVHKRTRLLKENEEMELVPAYGRGCHWKKNSDGENVALQRSSIFLIALPYPTALAPRSGLITAHFSGVAVLYRCREPRPVLNGFSKNPVPECACADLATQPVAILHRAGMSRAESTAGIVKYFRAVLLHLHAGIGHYQLQDAIPTFGWNDFWEPWKTEIKMKAGTFVIQKRALLALGSPKCESVVHRRPLDVFNCRPTESRLEFLSDRYSESDERHAKLHLGGIISAWVHGRTDRPRAKISITSSWEVLGNWKTACNYVRGETHSALLSVPFSQGSALENAWGRRQGEATLKLPSLTPRFPLRLFGNKSFSSQSAASSRLSQAGHERNPEGAPATPLGMTCVGNPPPPPVALTTQNEEPRERCLEATSSKHAFFFVTGLRENPPLLPRIRTQNISDKELTIVADLPGRSLLVRHRCGVREALGSNPGQDMGKSSSVCCILDSNKCFRTSVFKSEFTAAAVGQKLKQNHQMSKLPAAVQCVTMVLNISTAAVKKVTS